MNSSPKPQPAAEAGRYLTFSLGDESYGFPVLKVREIIRLCPITPVLRMPAYVKGVINLRGTVIPVFDLRAKFQFATTSYGERSCIIVVQVATPSGENTLIGTIVDAVEEVVHLTAADIEAAPDFGDCLLDLRRFSGHNSQIAFRHFARIAGSFQGQVKIVLA